MGNTQINNLIGSQASHFCSQETALPTHNPMFSHSEIESKSGDALSQGWDNTQCSTVVSQPTVPSGSQTLPLIGQSQTLTQPLDDASLAMSQSSLLSSTSQTLSPDKASSPTPSDTPLKTLFSPQKAPKPRYSLVAAENQANTCQNSASLSSYPAAPTKAFVLPFKKTESAPSETTVHMSSFKLKPRKKPKNIVKISSMPHLGAPTWLN